MNAKFVNQYKSMNGYKLDIILMAILFACIFFLFCLSISLEIADEMDLFLFLGFIVGVVFGILNAVKDRRIFSKIPNPKLSVQVTVSVDEDSLLYTDADGISVTLKWKEIQSVKRLSSDRGLWFFSERYNIGVDARFFTKGNMVDLIHFLESKHLDFEAL